MSMFDFILYLLLLILAVAACVTSYSKGYTAGFQEGRDVGFDEGVMYGGAILKMTAEAGDQIAEWIKGLDK